MILRGGNLGDKGAVQIAKALMNPYTKVQTLGLRNNKISYDGAKALAEQFDISNTIP